MLDVQSSYKYIHLFVVVNDNKINIVTLKFKEFNQYLTSTLILYIVLACYQIFKYM